MTVADYRSTTFRGDDSAQKSDETFRRGGLAANCAVRTTPPEISSAASVEVDAVAVDAKGTEAWATTGRQSC
jgi:hypothetical protein